MNHLLHVGGPSFAGLMQYRLCVLAVDHSFPVRYCPIMGHWVGESEHLQQSSSNHVLDLKSSSRALDPHAANWSAASAFGGRQDLSRDVAVPAGALHEPAMT